MSTERIELGEDVEFWDDERKAFRPCRVIERHDSRRLLTVTAMPERLPRTVNADDVRRIPNGRKLFVPQVGDLVDVNVGDEWRTGSVESTPIPGGGSTFAVRFLSTGTLTHAFITQMRAVQVATQTSIAVARTISKDFVALDCKSCGIPVGPGMAGREEHADCGAGAMFAPSTRGNRRQEAAGYILSKLVPLASDLDVDTPARYLGALDELTSGYGTDLKQLLKVFPLEGNADPGVVAVRSIPFASLCAHHVLPFSGTVDVAYIPTSVIVGLSKIPRLVRAVTRRLQTQEHIGVQVAEALMLHVGAAGAMVVVRGRHSCMALRGVESPGEMVTSCVRGVFRTEPSARSEALSLLR